MAKQAIGIGSSADDGNGDPLRTAFDKCNDNFDELYLTVIEAGTTGETYSAFDLLYRKASDGKWWKADASAEATAGPVELGIAIEASTAADQTKSVQLRGLISGLSGLTAGPYFAGETAGAYVVSASKPTAEGTIVRLVGHARSATTLMFTPDVSYVVNGYTLSVNNQTGTSYTLVAADAGKVIEMENASANVLTIPLHSSVAFSNNVDVTVVQLGAGATTIRGASGVTLNGTAEAGGNESDVAVSGQYKGASLYQHAEDEWIVIV